MKVSLLALLILLTGCVTTDSKTSEIDPNDYFVQIQDGLEFATTPRQTVQVFQRMRQDGGQSMDAMLDVLGDNLSSAVLIMDDAFADQISLSLNLDKAGMAKAMNQRVSRGISVISIQDVTQVTDEGNLVKVRVDSPGILSGFVYVLKEPIPRRSSGDQTFVDFYMTGQAPRKLSISAMMGLLQK